jgi:hypothetical protein
MRLGIELERHRKAERDDLHDEPGNHCTADRDAINLPLFQLTEERTHLSPRRLRSIAYLSHYVEPAVAALPIRWREIRIRLIAVSQTL